jgi:hypothetical protein
MPLSICWLSCTEEDKEFLRLEVLIDCISVYHKHITNVSTPVIIILIISNDIFYQFENDFFKMQM